MDEKAKEQEITLKDEERTKCEIWTRVMGYHRPTSSFNIGKQGEFANASTLLKASAAVVSNP